MVQYLSRPAPKEENVKKAKGAGGVNNIIWNLRVVKTAMETSVPGFANQSEAGHAGRFFIKQPTPDSPKRSAKLNSQPHRAQRRQM